MTLLKLMQIPQLNSIVIKQEGGHFFISTPNSFIIDKAGWIRLTEELANIGFIDRYDLKEICYRLEERMIYENKENSSNTD